MVYLHLISFEASVFPPCLFLPLQTHSQTTPWIHAINTPLQDEESLSRAPAACILAGSARQGCMHQVHVIIYPPERTTGYTGRTTHQGVELVRVAGDADFGGVDRDGGLDVAAVGDVLRAVAHGHVHARHKHVNHVADHATHHQWIDGRSHFAYPTEMQFKMIKPRRQTSTEFCGQKNLREHTHRDSKHFGLYG